MTTINQAYRDSLLAQAAYANFSSGAIKGSSPLLTASFWKSKLR